MAKRYLTVRPNGGLSVTEINADDPAKHDLRLAKAMFELSRESFPPDEQGNIKVKDPLEKFNPDIHTRDAIERGIPNHVPLTYREADSADLPATRTFRNAWEDTGAAIAVNMPKARSIHMDRIRAARDVELARKDIEWAKADLAGRARIDEERQVLRDLPETFDLSGATTADELVALWPIEVGRPIGI